MRTFESAPAPHCHLGALGARDSKPVTLEFRETKISLAWPFGPALWPLQAPAACSNIEHWFVPRDIPKNSKVSKAAQESWSELIGDLFPYPESPFPSCKCLGHLPGIKLLRPASSEPNWTLATRDSLTRLHLLSHFQVRSDPVIHRGMKRRPEAQFRRRQFKDWHHWHQFPSSLAGL